MKMKLFAIALLVGFFAIPAHGASSGQALLRVLNKKAATLAPVEHSFLGQAELTFASGDNTQSSATLGTAHADRKIAVVVTVRDGTDVAVTCTVAGQSGTSLARNTAAPFSANFVTQVFVASVPTGTTGDIVVNLGAASNWLHIGWYRLVGWDSTPYDTATLTATSGTIDISDNGLLIAGNCSADTGPNGVAFTCVSTENYDVLTSSGASDDNSAGAHEFVSSAEVGRTVAGNAAEPTSSTVVVSLQPAAGYGAP